MEQPRRHARRVHLRCTIEMLEHGACSIKPHVGTHGDVPEAAHGPSPAAAAGRAGERRMHHAYRGARGRTDDASRDDKSAREGDKQVAHPAHPHPQAVVKVPTAGTVMAGWAKDLGSWF